MDFTYGRISDEELFKAVDTMSYDNASTEIIVEDSE